MKHQIKYLGKVKTLILPVGFIYLSFCIFKKERSTISGETNESVSSAFCALPRI